MIIVKFMLHLPNIDQNSHTVFERKYIFQPIILGIHVKFRGCILSGAMAMLKLDPVWDMFLLRSSRVAGIAKHSFLMLFGVGGMSQW